MRREVGGAHRRNGDVNEVMCTVAVARIRTRYGMRGQRIGEAANLVGGGGRRGCGRYNGLWTATLSRNVAPRLETKGTTIDTDEDEESLVRGFCPPTDVVHGLERDLQDAPVIAECPPVPERGKFNSRQSFRPTLIDSDNEPLVGRGRISRVVHRQ